MTPVRPVQYDTLADQTGQEAPAGIWSAEHLAECLGEVAPSSTAIICVGNELRGDDGAGPVVARALLLARQWYVYDAGLAPESFLMKIATTKPDLVVVVDTLHFGAAAGAVELIAPESLSGGGPSTHGPAPTVFLQALRMLHRCRCVVLGIQPDSMEFGRGLSAPVSAAVQRIVEAFGILAQDSAPDGAGPGTA